MEITILWVTTVTPLPCLRRSCVVNARPGLVRLPRLL